MESLSHEVYQPPKSIGFSIIDEQSIYLHWLPVQNGLHYEVRVDGFTDTIVVNESSTTIRGLLPSIEYLVSVRATYDNGQKSDWANLIVKTSYGVPFGTDGRYSVIEPIVGYNNALVFDMPDFYGTFQSCTLRLWWQPSDQGWWASLEVPTNTPVIKGRRMGLNCGILDDADGILNGNIVMRSASIYDTIEPGPDCFRNKTHELRWEPNS